MPPPNNSILNGLISFAALVVVCVLIWYLTTKKNTTLSPTRDPSVPQAEPPIIAPVEQPTTPTPTPTGTGKTAPTTPKAPTNVKLDEDKRLQKGVKGAKEEVKELQRLLNKIVNQLNGDKDGADYWSKVFGSSGSSSTTVKVPALTVDGDFGKKTDDFIVKYLPLMHSFITLKLARYWIKTTYKIE